MEFRIPLNTPKGFLLAWLEQTSSRPKPAGWGFVFCRASGLRRWPEVPGADGSHRPGWLSSPRCSRHGAGQQPPVTPSLPSRGWIWGEFSAGDFLGGARHDFSWSAPSARAHHGVLQRPMIPEVSAQVSIAPQPQDSLCTPARGFLPLWVHFRAVSSF